MNTKLKRRNISPGDRKVFLALSGGVDSAVSAALLKSQGYDVTGVFIKVWQPFDEAQGKPLGPCTWREERRDAMRVAIALNIPFLFFNFEAEYKKGVVDKIIREFEVGRTPNPDVLCNREIKFGAFWREAKRRGADLIATGHYARVVYGGLTEALDKEKDQSYFLWTLTRADLSHTIFPVGDMRKDEVRKLAEKYHLPVAEKRDSQGICFIGDVSMDEFLTHFIKTSPGKVLNTSGEMVGKHSGVAFYTIGERHGLDISTREPLQAPFFVVSKDVKSNTIIVSSDPEEIKTLSPKKVLVENANWISEPSGPNFSARIRYRGEKVPITLSLEDRKLLVELEKPMPGLSLGQSIVFYQDEVCLGGAIMDKVVD